MSKIEAKMYEKLRRRKKIIINKRLTIYDDILIDNIDKCK